MNRQRLLLAILLVVLALAVGYSVIRFPRQQQAEKLSNAPGATSPRTNRKGAPGDDSRVRLDLLQKTQVGFTGFKKNIFAPIFRDLSKLPPVKPVIPAPPPPPPPPPVVTAPAVSPVEQELAQFTFLGFLEKERKKTIFLARNKEIILVKKGERIANRYEATAITDDALTLRRLGGDTTEIVIPLIENQSLKASPQPQSGASQPHQGGAVPPQPQAGRPRRPERAFPPQSPGAVPGATPARPVDE